MQQRFSFSQLWERKIQLCCASLRFWGPYHLRDKTMLLKELSTQQTINKWSSTCVSFHCRPTGIWNGSPSDSQRQGQPRTTTSRVSLPAPSQVPSTYRSTTMGKGKEKCPGTVSHSYGVMFWIKTTLEKRSTNPPLNKNTCQGECLLHEFPFNLILQGKKFILWKDIDCL